MTRYLDYYLMHHLRLSEHQQCAAAIVNDVIVNHKSLSGLLPVQTFQQKTLPAQDRATVQHLVYTTLRHWGQARGCLRQLCEKAPPEPLIALLGVALVQLYWHSSQPAQVVDQAVEATRLMGLPAFAKLTNGVLRRALREKEHILALNEKETSSFLSCPTWWYKKLMQQYSAAQATEILKSTLGHPPMTLRINQKKTTLAAYQKLLNEAQLSHTTIGEEGIILATPASVYALPHFKEGWVSVQDAGAQLTPYLLSPLKEDARVLDACAAPGGKTAHILEHYDNIQMIALDHDKERVKQLYSTLDRLQLKATRVETADAGDKAKRWWNRQHFDAIILDAPCSGSGVIRRHPDIKWLRLPEDLAGFARQQKRLLANLWETLKPGGELLYITCSLFSEENEYVIREFLEKTADAKRIELKHPWLDDKGRMLPNEVRDGFFYAKLQKASKK